MSPFPIPPLNPPSAPAPSRTPDKIRDAAEQFEALLLGQILHAARDPDSSASEDSMTDFAEQQLATVMSRAGGLGIASQIVRGMAASPTEQRPLPPDRSPASDSMHPGI
jgi:Rod binding domain-containing protein